MARIWFLKADFEHPANPGGRRLDSGGRYLRTCINTGATIRGMDMAMLRVRRLAR
jgi:hypothetical protein